LETWPQVCRQPPPERRLTHLIALEQNFHPYLQAFLPFLAPALKAYDDPQLCSVAVGLIGDICRALGELSAGYCNMFMSTLLENLTSPVLDRNVKISVVACFGDIAMAIGPAFEPYLGATMTVLRQAGDQKIDPVSSNGLFPGHPLTIEAEGLRDV
jgi:importin subunit beta-1